MCHVILMMPILALPMFWLLPLSLAALAYGMILLLTIWLYYFVIRAMRRPTEMGPETLLGRTGEVVAVEKDSVRIRVQSEIWKADCSEPLRNGDVVEVTARNGLTLCVRRFDSRQGIPLDESGESPPLHGE